MWIHSTGMGTTAPVNKDSGACLLRSPFVQVKNFDDMPTASFVNEKYALRVETSDVATHHSPHQLQQHPQWENSSEELARARASLPSASTDQTRQSFVPGTVASRQSVTSRESDSQFPRSSLNLMRKEDQPLIENQVESSEDDRMPLYDIASMHASHEDHTATIVEAHRREVASLRMYITFLEQRRGLSRTNNDHIHPPVGSRSGARDSESNAGLAMTLPGHLSAAGAPYPRHEHLNPSLDTHCTSYAGYGEIWLECNHLRNRLETCRRQIAHAEETISRMQRLELSLKSENGNLRSRLLAANNERMDVQEGLYEAYKDLRNLAEREAGLIQENEELRRRNIHVTRSTVLPENANSPARRRKAGHCRTMSDVSYQDTQSGPSLAQVATRITIRPKHAQKQQTETELSERRQQAQVGDVRRQSNPHRSQMSELKSPSARSVPRQNIDATASTRNGNTNVPCKSESCRNETLSHEDHCTQTDGVQPIGHGLQGTTIAEFDSSTAQNQHGTYPTTPKNRTTPKRCLPTARTPSPSPSLSSSKSSSTSPSALGISLPQTPRTIASTAVEAHPMPTTELQSFAYPKTPPAGMNKRLPKTPPLDSDPLLLPVAAHSPVIKRGETMKSVGGSIIELYAGRGRGDGSEWAREGLSEDGGWVDWV